MINELMAVDVTLPTDPRPHVWVKTGGVTVRALLDTGAALTALSSSLYAKLNNKNELQKAPFNKAHANVTGVSGLSLIHI